ncbi:MAG TPA: hypothetical protein VM661_14725 [Candidatus Sulfotelmatobacter sp.]|jgi:hypothetical protein|nr:hypothetical protein [Candidatus Sulfotelmatobacter sp.]
MLDWAETIWISLSWTQLLGICVVSVLVLWLGGHALPPVRTAKGWAEMPVPPAVLFPLMADAQGQLSWRRDLAAVDEQADGGWAETYASGEVIRLRTLESRPFRRISRRFVSDRADQGRWSADLTPLSDDRTLVMIEEQTDLSGPWRRLRSWLFSHPKERLEHYLADLAEAAKKAGKGKRWQ